MTIIYLGRTLLGGSSNQPGRASGKGRFAKKLRPIRSCSKWGLPGTKSPAFLGVSYTSVPSLPVTPSHEVRRSPSAVHFCGTILQLALTGRYPAPCPMEPGLSSRGSSAAGDCLSNFRKATLDSIQALLPADKSDLTVNLTYPTSFCRVFSRCFRYST